ncbi:MAG: LytTR family DNA-binding domain-containing protein [Bacteroidales bacterium]|nr:LytTR family DNA-binding domain-containing protein [Bacteroidales bacterium]
MAAVTCIIVDDDIFPTRVMSGYINRTDDIALVQCFTNAIDAINFLSSTDEGKNVGIIFLDIEMPEMSGIEFMRAVDLSHKEVIIYSSQEKYALEAYEYDVCDYLLKPVSYARFVRAVMRAKMNLSKREVPEHTESNSDNDWDCAFFRDNAGALHKTKYDDIVMLETMENYVSITTLKEKILVHVTMKKIVELLPPNIVARIHRSYAVGLKHICNIDKDHVTIEYGREKITLPYSRYYCQDLMKRMNSTPITGSDGCLFGFDDVS